MRHMIWSLVNMCRHVTRRHVIGRRGGTCQAVIRLKSMSGIYMNGTVVSRVKCACLKYFTTKCTKFVVDVIVIVFTFLAINLVTCNE